MNRIALEAWIREPEFRNLMDEIHYHKKNFFESSLMKLVADGEPAAVIFVNKTVNRDRGYNDKIDLNLNVKQEGGIDVDALPVHLKRQLLEEVRKQKTLSNPEGVIEGEFRKLEYKQDPVLGEQSETIESGQVSVEGSIEDGK